jgi:hypothetical protein
MKKQTNHPLSQFWDKLGKTSKKIIVSIIAVIFFIVLLFTAMTVVGGKGTNSQQTWENVEAKIVNNHKEELSKEGYENVTAELKLVIKLERENHMAPGKRTLHPGETLEEMIEDYYDYYADYYSVDIDNTSYLFKTKAEAEDFLAKIKKYDNTDYQIKTIKNLVKGESKQEDIDKIISTKKTAYEKAQAEAKAKAEAEARRKAEQRSSQSGSTNYSVAEYKAYAHDLVINTYGWSESDFDALVKLWNRESGWNPNAHNKSSGAHGIPQSLPASKMASEGADYYTNGKTQIRWGLKYIKGRYGTPSQAWAHSQRTGWY